ncbi:hypothetical protein K438DRAFT_1427722, partial [Mycena galopus ATCC 62051]
YGPMLIGVFLNMILYGVPVRLALYHLGSNLIIHSDRTWMRLLVSYLFVVGTANTVLDMHMMYEPLILGYGKSDPFLCMVLSDHPHQVLVSMPIQLFFAWRIYQLTKSFWIPSLIAVLGIASFGGGIWTTTMVHILKLFVKKPLLHKPALLWFLTSCVADVLITISLVWTLSKKKTGYKATDSVVDKIIRATIQTGLIT